MSSKIGQKNHKFTELNKFRAVMKMTPKQLKKAARRPKVIWVNTGIKKKGWFRDYLSILLTGLLINACLIWPFNFLHILSDRLTSAATFFVCVLTNSILLTSTKDNCYQIPWLSKDNSTEAPARLVLDSLAKAEDELTGPESPLLKISGQAFSKADFFKRELKAFDVDMAKAPPEMAGAEAVKQERLSIVSIEQQQRALGDRAKFEVQRLSECFAQLRSRIEPSISFATKFAAGCERRRKYDDADAGQTQIDFMIPQITDCLRDISNETAGLVLSSSPEELNRGFMRVSAFTANMEDLLTAQQTSEFNDFNQTDIESDQTKLAHRT